MNYDYRKAMNDDIKTVIGWDYKKELNDQLATKAELNDICQYFYDILWDHDGITGNGSGSYTFSRYKAEEYLTHNFDLLFEAIEEFGGNLNDWLSKGPEFCDTAIRSYLLYDCIYEVLSRII